MKIRMKMAVGVSLASLLLVGTGCSMHQAKPEVECSPVPTGVPGVVITHCAANNGVTIQGGPVVVDRYAITSTGGHTEVKHLGGAAQMGTAQGVIQNATTAAITGGLGLAGDVIKAHATVKAAQENSGGTGTIVYVASDYSSYVGVNEGGCGASGCDDTF